MRAPGVGSAPYLAVAAQVRAGEWTTYGEISLAVRGDVQAAHAIGRMAATHPAFPNAHRVIGQGGIVPAGWQDGQGRGPEECRRRLEAEGVSFAAGGRAEPACRVGWNDLRGRWQDAPR